MELAQEILEERQTANGVHRVEDFCYEGEQRNEVVSGGARVTKVRFYF